MHSYIFIYLLFIYKYCEFFYKRIINWGRMDCQRYHKCMCGDRNKVIGFYRKYTLHTIVPGIVLTSFLDYINIYHVM